MYEGHWGRSELSLTVLIILTLVAHSQARVHYISENITHDGKPIEFFRGGGGIATKYMQVEPEEIAEAISEGDDILSGRVVANETVPFEVGFDFYYWTPEFLEETNRTKICTRNLSLIHDWRMEDLTFRNGTRVELLFWMCPNSLAMDGIDPDMLSNLDCCEWECCGNDPWAPERERKLWMERVKDIAIKVAALSVAALVFASGIVCCIFRERTTITLCVKDAQCTDDIDPNEMTELRSRLVIPERLQPSSRPTITRSTVINDDDPPEYTRLPNAPPPYSEVA